MYQRTGNGVHLLLAGAGERESPTARIAQGELVQLACEEEAVLLRDDHGAGESPPLLVAGWQQEAVPGAQIEQRVVFEVGVAVKVAELGRCSPAVDHVLVLDGLLRFGDGAALCLVIVAGSQSEQGGAEGYRE